MALFAGSRTLLVVARRRGGALAAVVRPGSASRPARVLAAVRADAATPAEAAAAVTAMLRAARVRVPSRAVVLSPDVEARLVELPVDPARPLARSELSEMIRWEIEPYLPPHGARDAHQDVHGVTVGWTAPRSAEGPPWKWQIAGARDAALYEWGQVLASAGSRLIAAYPLAGCAAAVVPPDAPARFAVDEHVDGFVVRTVVDGGVVVARTTRSGGPDDPITDDGASAPAAGAPFLTIAPGVVATPQELAPLAGAARHAAGVVRAGLCACARPRKRRSGATALVAAAAAVVLAAVIYASERSIERQLGRLAGVQELSREAGRLDATRAALDSRHAALAKLSKVPRPRAGGGARAAVVLDAVAAHAKSGLTLEHIRFDDAAGVTFDGSARTPEDAAAFREAMTLDLAAAGLLPVEASIDAGRGAAAASAFRFRFVNRAAEASR